MSDVSVGKETYQNVSFHQALTRMLLIGSFVIFAAGATGPALPALVLAGRADAVEMNGFFNSTERIAGAALLLSILSILVGLLIVATQGKFRGLAAASPHAAPDRYSLVVERVPAAANGRWERLDPCKKNPIIVDRNRNLCLF